MKKVLLLVPVLFLMLSATAAARGIVPGSFAVSVVADGYTFDGEQHLKTMPVVGVRGGYNVTRFLGIEGLFDYIPTSSTRPGRGDVNVYRYGIELLLHFYPEKDLVPYLAAGYGGLFIKPETGGDESRGAVDYGIGVKYFLTDNLAVRGDLRHLLLRNGEMLSNYEYTTGIVYQFGGRRPALASEGAVGSPLPEPEVPEPPAEPETAPEEAPPEPPPAAEPAPGRFKYCVTLQIEFDIDQALIRPHYHDEVARVGDFMNRHPTTTAVIEGHTDNVGAADHNLELSQRRAWSVVDYLAEHFGIDRARLSARGYGATRPRADNASDQARQQNRRIEAIIDCAFVPEEVEPPQRLCMQLDVQFDQGKADILPRYRSGIAAVASYLKRYPTTTAVIEGHTDNVGGKEFNLKLSQLRARNVVDYLVTTFGIDRTRLSAQGYGSSRRIAYNDTPEGRQKNRRINAVIDCVIRK